MQFANNKWLGQKGMQGTGPVMGEALPERAQKDFARIRNTGPKCLLTPSIRKRCNPHRQHRTLGTTWTSAPKSSLSWRRDSGEVVAIAHSLPGPTVVASNAVLASTEATTAFHGSPWTFAQPS